MTTKIIYVYLIFTIFAIFSACCKENYKITGPQEFIAVDLRNHSMTAVQIINYEFALKLTSKFRTSQTDLGINIISESYALSCSENYENEFLINATELYCDRDIIFKGDTIYANSNLVFIPAFYASMRNYKTEIHFEFREAFLNKLVLPQGLTTFKIKAYTTDGLFMELERELFFNF